MIIIESDLCKIQHCKNLITLYNIHEDDGVINFRDTRCLKEEDIISSKFIFNEFYENVYKFVNKHIKIKRGWAQVVEWPEGSSQLVHFDDADVYSSISTITYLNDNYEGGETVFADGTTVVPSIGKTLIFDGIKYPHSVNPVKNGKRFTFASWNMPV